MGKSNRIKRTKENERVMSLNDYSKVKKNKGMPNWAINLIAIVVTVAVLLSVALIAITSNGVIMRVRTAMASDNYRVSGNMMSYYFNTTYQNFVSNYQSYSSYLSLNTELPVSELKNQVIGDTSANANAMDTSLIGAEYDGKTWYDYFMDQTQNEIRTMLYYCEEADNRGIKLGDEEKTTIDESIASIRTTAESYGYTLNAYLSMAYGKGVSESDVRDAMELSALSSKAMTEITKTFNDAITAERIEAKYGEDKINFDLIDYTYYTIRVNYSDIETEVKDANADATEEEILEAYKNAIAEAKTEAEKLLEKTNSDDFEKFYLAYVANDEFDGAVETASEGVEEEKLTDENLDTIRTAMVEALVKEVMEDKATTETPVTKTDDKFDVYGVEVSEAWAEVFEEAKTTIFNTLVTGQATYVKDGANYVENDDFSTWAFNAERKENETHKIYKGDGADESKDITASGDKYFYASVYLLRKPQYVNDEKARDVAYMLFSSEAEATAAIEALAAEGTLSVEAFERIADEKGAAAHTTIEDYIKGNMGSDKFDAWLYDEATAIGSYNATAITLSDGTYGVFYYVADGEEAWRVNVKTTLLEEDFTAFSTTLEESLSATIKVKDKVCAKSVG